MPFCAPSTTPRSELSSQGWMTMVLAAGTLVLRAISPLDVSIPREMESLLASIKRKWGSLDFVVHSIAFCPKETLQRRVVDVPRDGFLTDNGRVVLELHSHGASCRAADAGGRNAFHDDLLWQPARRRQLQHHGGGESGA